MIEIGSLESFPAGTAPPPLSAEFAKALADAHSMRGLPVPADSPAAQVAFAERPQPRQASGYSLRDMADQFMRLDQTVQAQWDDHISGRSHQRLSTKYGLVDDSGSVGSDRAREILTPSTGGGSGLAGGYGAATASAVHNPSSAFTTQGHPLSTGAAVFGRASTLDGQVRPVAVRGGSGDAIRITEAKKGLTGDDYTSWLAKMDDYKTRMAMKQVENSLSLAELNTQLTARNMVFQVAMSAKDLAGKIMNKLTSGS